MAELNTNQKAAVLASLSQQNVFLTGSAGVGKSFTLQRIIQSLSGRVGITGSTGIAAVQIGGVTLNSFFSVHPDMVTKQEVRFCAAWTEIDSLVIDEVSMLHPDLFVYLDGQARKSRKRSEPFGGVQLIVVGDFFQLPPVHREKNPKYEFVFELPLWNTLFVDNRGVIIELTEVYRQSDRAFVELLERIRRGVCNLSDSMILTDDTRSKEDSAKYTKLFSKCDSVDKCNLRELQRLPGEAMEYNVTFRFEASNGKAPFSVGEKKKYEQQTLNNLPIGSSLALKEKASVMLVANVCPEMGLVNGSRGVVESFEVDSGLPIVRFDALLVKVRPYDWTVQLGTRGKVIVNCLPLKLATAITIHKSQGQTIDGLVVNLSSVWEYGQAYTSLSRAKSLDRLVVEGYNTACVKAHPKVLQYYSKIHSGK
jgi:ATP-dependent DNA helicase PIF1